MVDREIYALADYGVRKGLIDGRDRVWAINQLLQVLGLDS